MTVDPKFSSILPAGDSLKIDDGFRKALDRAYHSRAHLNKLFTEQRSTIERLVRWSLRGNHWGVISDEDDLYQEACIWIVDCLWRWDETRGTPLAEYVVYNVGARLRNALQKELASKRRPKKPNVSLNKKKYNDEDNDMTVQDTVASNDPSAEERLAYEEVMKCIDTQMTFVEKRLLDFLIEEDGNFKEAAIKLQRVVRGANTMSEGAFRMHLRRNVVPKIHSFLVKNNYVNAGTKKKFVQNFVHGLLFPI